MGPSAESRHTPTPSECSPVPAAGTLMGWLELTPPTRLAGVDSSHSVSHSSWGGTFLALQLFESHRPVSSLLSTHERTL